MKFLDAYNKCLQTVTLKPLLWFLTIKGRHDDYVLAKKFDKVFRK